MDGAGHHGRRPRPVADAPTADPVAIAKAWLLALVAEAPLAQAGAVPAAELARGGPELCAAVLAALSSDRELERLVGGDGRPAPGAAAARLTGARTPAALAAGVEALRAVTWRALRAALGDAPPELMADLGDRLAHVCARVTAASLAAPAVPGRAGPLATALAGAPTEPGPAPAADPEAPPPPRGVHVVDPPPGGGVDPLTTLAEELAASPPAGADWPAGGAAGGPTVTRGGSVDTSWEDAGRPAPPWLSAIDRRLRRRRSDGRPFAVLVVEIDDLDRLLAAQSGREVAVALEAAERGLTAELAPADLVVRERLGRWWLTSPDRDGASARELGARIAAAIGRAVLAGAPLAASVGVAACPEHGASVADLAGRADQGMFAARAAGVPLT
ncbi:hypothetical protein FSW04_08855 [Baekduia soli]|uniref:GGDEF domain-containing protein n=1 Tax=Baekduia soli TaxID=496014 RepID=A0A5B8U407_9ACTN|nr:hypothetical protein [Baekduia soli]QEC47671.1 hypothetical protein FSW04_08855 [Baekduia soli]